MKIKGRERRKSQRAKIFGKENKRRTKKREKGKAQEGIAFLRVFFFFLKVNVPKNKKRDLL